MRSHSASLTFRSFTCAPVAVSDTTAGLSSNRTLSSLVVRRMAPEDFFPQRRRQARQDGRDLLGGGFLQQPGEQLGGAVEAEAAALLVAERLPLGRGEGPVEQWQRVALLVAKVAVQLAGQGVDGVPQALVAAVAVVEGAVDGDTDGVINSGPGLLDATGANVVLVVRDHGPKDPGRVDEQIHTFGSCNPTCTDLQMSMHSAG
jgi:hypothetical protein